MAIRNEVLNNNYKRLEQAQKLREEDGALNFIADTEFKKAFFGMNAETGAKLSGAAHIKQSIDRVLTTKKGSRYLAREFGSDLLNLTDSPANPVGLLKLKQAINIAISDFEPRVEIQKAEILPSINGKLNYKLDYEILEN